MCEVAIAYSNFVRQIDDHETEPSGRSAWQRECYVWMAGIYFGPAECADMNRFETKFENDRFYLETDDGWIEVGTERAILDDLGESYTIEYDERERTAVWLETDDGDLTFDVRETLQEMSFTEEFVAQVADCDLSKTTDNGVPVRTAVFADLMRAIWDSKGNLGD